MPKNKELRFNSCELRVQDAQSEDSVGLVAGYAAVFDQLSEDLGGFREKIAQGAFGDSIKGDVRALWSHNPALILGRTTNQTLKLIEDSRGLGFELALPNTSIGRDALNSIKRRDVTGMSFGFFVEEDAWQRAKPGVPHIRTLLKVEVFEVSPVAFPAYPQTDVSSRALVDIEKVWAEQDAKVGHLIVDLKPKVNRLYLGAGVDI